MKDGAQTNEANPRGSRSPSGQLKGFVDWCSDFSSSERSWRTGAEAEGIPPSFRQAGKTHTLFPFGIGFGSIERLQISEVGQS